MLLRKLSEEREEKVLRRCALKSADSRGRFHREKDDPFRTVYLRDRDRIIHSSAFRRLEFKTQVFLHNEGDYYRTRLTHTLEVSQIARSVAYTLRLNEGFTEALALAHDLGHPPFGHTGEQVLNGLMNDHGGFEHNRQALRIVDILEKKYPGFDGLNLSHEIRESLPKHGPGVENGACGDFRVDLAPFLETRIVNISDMIAYQHHDLDDGLQSGVLSEQDLSKSELWQEASLRVRQEHPGCSGRIRLRSMVNAVVKATISDLMEGFHRFLTKHEGKDAAAMREMEPQFTGFSRPMAVKVGRLQDLLMDKFYCHPRVLRDREKAEEIVEQLFGIYLNKMDLLPRQYRRTAEEEGPERSVCDYIAGMTDRYALEEWNRLKG